MRANIAFALFFFSIQLHANDTIMTRFTYVGVDFNSGMAMITLGMDSSLASYPYTTECDEAENDYRVVMNFSAEDFLPGWQAVYATVLAALAQDVTAGVTVLGCVEEPQGVFSRSVQGIIISQEASY